MLDNAQEATIEEAALAFGAAAAQAAGTPATGPSTDTSTVRTLEEALSHLERHRRCAAGFRKVYADALAAFEASMAGVKGEIKHLDDLAALAEGEIRLLGIAAFKATGNKHPHPAVGVQETKVYTYDVPTVTAWAIEHKHTQLLNLNKGAFEKVAAVLEAPGFAVGIELKATIATDLTKVLGLEVAP